jgi:hypothetical protein
MQKKKKNNKKLKVDGFYFDKNQSYTLYKDVDGNIIRKKRKKI